VDDGGLQSDDDSLSDEIVNLSLLSDAGGADTPPPKKGPGDRRASDGVPLENILSEVDDIAKEIGSFDDNLESFLVSEGGGGDVPAGDMEALVEATERRLEEATSA
jgi:hypothetical protein